MEVLFIGLNYLLQDIYEIHRLNLLKWIKGISMDNYSSQKEKWNSLASTWIDAGPPASPSGEDIKNFDKLLRDGYIISVFGLIANLTGRD